LIENFLVILLTDKLSKAKTNLLDKGTHLCQLSNKVTMKPTEPSNVVNTKAAMQADIVL